MYLLKFDGATRRHGYCIYQDGALIASGSAQGSGTNNEGEYQGLLLGLRAAIGLGIRELHIEGDSMLVVCQVTDRWLTKAPHLIPLRNQAQDLLHWFDDYWVRWIPREMNQDADSMTRT